MRMSIHRTIRHVFIRGGLACFLIGLYLLTSFMMSTMALTDRTTTIAHAAASEPGCMTTTHCYGITRWHSGGLSSFTGAYTSISTVPLYTNTSGTHIFTQEMWLNEDSQRCNASRYGSCWLEVGYGNFRAWYGGRFYAGMFYFWAETRPGLPALFVHILGPVKSSQFGQTQNYSIRRMNSTTYQIMAGTYIAYSTQNTMVANGITIGEELSNAGALASTRSALFTRTAEQDAHGWHFFQSTGQTVVMNPLMARWIGPTPTHGLTFSTAWS